MALSDPASDRPVAVHSSFDCRIVAIEQLTPKVRELHLRRMDGKPLRFEPGQHLVVHLDEGDGQRTARYYSLCRPPRDDGLAALCIKHDGDSDSPASMFELAEGDRIECQGPGGAFVLDDGDRDLLLVATGTGVAPFRSMFDQLDQKLLRCSAWLVFGAREASDLLYDADWRALSLRRPAFRYLPTLSEPVGGRWRGARGRVQRQLEALLRGATPPDPARTVAYVCGHPQMLDDVHQLLVDSGFSSSTVRREQ